MKTKFLKPYKLLGIVLSPAVPSSSSSPISDLLTFTLEKVSFVNEPEYIGISGTVQLNQDGGSSFQTPAYGALTETSLILTADAESSMTFTLAENTITIRDTSLNVEYYKKSDSIIIEYGAKLHADFCPALFGDVQLSVPGK